MVKNKKGIATAVDWIIAVGIFLVYFGLVFVFFKPGVSDVFDEDTLLGIVEEGFMNDVTWNMTKTPIFLEQTQEGSTPLGEGPHQITLFGLDEETPFDFGGFSKVYQVPEELEGSFEPPVDLQGSDKPKKK